MRDIEPYRALLGLTAPWTVAGVDVDMRAAGRRAGDPHSVTVARRGKLVFERYFTGQDERWGTPLGEVKFGPGTLHDLRSISKSVVSLLVGIALREGTFPSIDSAVFDQFPEYAALKTPEKARITFWHLLTMSSGFAWNEAIPYSNPANSERRLIDSAEPARYVLEQPMTLPPGYLYNYNGGNTALLAAVLAKKTGQTLDAYAREKLFAPLGITDSEWVVMPASSTAAAASGARLRPRDLAAPTLIVLGDQDIVKPEHGVELTRLISDARLLILPGGHGDYLGEAEMTQKETRYPELTARLIEEFLDSR